MRRPTRLTGATGVAAALLALGGCSSASAPTAAPGSSSASPTGTLPTTTARPSTTPTPAPSPRATPSRTATTRPTTTSAHLAAPACRRVVVIGYSVRHRALTACERGTPGGSALLVVGNIHGDERIGWSVVSRLRSASVPSGVDLWLVQSVNPDGSAAGTRGNAHGVDENRNWPYHWVHTTPGSATYGGPAPLSEPETRAFERFLATTRPRTVVIFHSPLDAVDYSEGADPAVVRYLAAASGYPARHLGARPGELTGWYNGQPWGGDALTFEFASSASSAQLDRVSHALLALAAWRR